jgi:hypothetical protein
MSYKEKEQPLSVYTIFTKTTQPGFNTIKIKAASVTVSDDEKTVIFETSNKRVAQFNLAEIIGYANAENVV